ncbi:cation:proton antiporter [Caulobacter segnis]
MSFFESLLVLVAAGAAAAGVAPHQGAHIRPCWRRLGVCLALVPGRLKISIEPHTALALFLALGPGGMRPSTSRSSEVRRLWRPPFALVVVAVPLSAGAVAWLGVAMAGLPIAAALALGRSSPRLMRPPPPPCSAACACRAARSRWLKGESLLNDASALLLFSAALAFQAQGGIDQALAIRLGPAAPGGIVLGIVIAYVLRGISPLVSGTLGGNAFEFVTAFGSWMIAERLGVSPVLCLVAFAMTFARTAALRTPPRVRIHSFAVWTSAVFLLNVVAFLLMGLQARTIVAGMDRERLMQAAGFAAVVVVCLIIVRMAWVQLHLVLARRFPGLRGGYPAISLRNGVLVGWCGTAGPGHPWPPPSPCPGAFRSATWWC